ncbi:MAG: phage tail family protein [Syntrophomonadaceae bacterium]|nr:phage tail family protein [Syntrophomonadaceae bacterium]
MYGVKFKNIHSSFFGLVMLSKNRVLLPEISDEYVDIPGRDGSIYFPGSLKDRPLEIEFSISTKTLSELRLLCRQVAAWLYSKIPEILVFDDEPDVYYMAKVQNQLDLEQVMAMGRFVVQFRCEPLAYSISELQITSFFFGALNNAGTYEALPVITISAEMDRDTETTGAWRADEATINNPTLTIEDKILDYTGTLTEGQSLIIDCAKYQVTKAGVNDMANVSGEFPVLYAGDNDVQLVDTNNSRRHLTITYRERWL